METVAGCSIEPSLNLSTTTSLNSSAPSFTHTNDVVINPNLNDLGAQPKHLSTNNYNAILKSINNDLANKKNNILQGSNNLAFNHLKPINKTILYLNNNNNNNTNNNSASSSINSSQSNPLPVYEFNTNNNMRSSPKHNLNPSDASSNPPSVNVKQKTDSPANLISPTSIKTIPINSTNLNINNNIANNSSVKAPSNLIANSVSSLNNGEIPNIANSTNDLVNGAKNFAFTNDKVINSSIDTVLANIVDSLLHNNANSNNNSINSSINTAINNTNNIKTTSNDTSNTTSNNITYYR